MVQVYADRVQETTLPTGTGTLNLAGASAQFQSFISGIGTGNTVEYCLLGGNGTDWETGIGAVTSGSPNTLSRDTVYASSNSGSKISLTGTSTVFATAPAHRVQKRGLWSDLMSAPVPPTQAATGLNSWLNQPASSTVEDNEAGITVFQPAGAGTHNKALIQKTAPGTPYSISALVSIDSVLNTDFSVLDFGWSDGTNILVFEMQISATQQTFLVYQFTSFTEGGATQRYTTTLPGRMWWIKLLDDGTNLKLYQSTSGKKWTQMYSQARTSFLTSPSKIIFGADAYNQDTYATIHSWSQGTS